MNAGEDHATLNLTVQEGSPEETPEQRAQKEKQFEELVESWRRRARMNQTFVPDRPTA